MWTHVAESGRGSRWSGRMNDTWIKLGLLLLQQQQKIHLKKPHRNNNNNNNNHHLRRVKKRAGSIFCHNFFYIETLTLKKVTFYSIVFQWKKRSDS